MQVSPKLKLDQPAVRRTIDNAFVILAPEAVCSRSHIRRTILSGWCRNSAGAWLRS